MGRMKDRDFQIIKNGARLGYYDSGNELVRGLVAHAEAIEHELKATKEDEEEIVAKYGQAMGIVDRLQGNIVQLQRELTEAREGKKVLLPREVAEAIEKIRYSRDGITDYGILLTFTNGHSSSFGNAKEALSKRYNNSYSVLMNALVNGYTIEEPIDREQRLLIDIQQLFDSWDGRRRSDLAKDTLELVNEHFAEST